MSYKGLRPNRLSQKLWHCQVQSANFPSMEPDKLPNCQVECVSCKGMKTSRSCMNYRAAKICQVQSTSCPDLEPGKLLNCQAQHVRCGGQPPHKLLPKLLSRQV